MVETSQNEVLLAQARHLLEQADQPELLSDFNGRTGEAQFSLASQIFKLN